MRIINCLHTQSFNIRSSPYLEFQFFTIPYLAPVCSRQLIILLMYLKTIGLEKRPCLCTLIIVIFFYQLIFQQYLDFIMCISFCLVPTYVALKTIDCILRQTHPTTFQSYQIHKILSNFRAYLFVQFTY